MCNLATEQLNNAKNEWEKEDAIKLLKELNLSEAYFNLGVHAWKEKDHVKAVEYFEISRNRGNQEAWYVVGKLLYLGYDAAGHGVVQDPAKGLRYLRRAAKNIPAAAKLLKRYGHSLK